MSGQDDIIECPCYRICAELGVEMGRWCRYREADAPPAGMHDFDPKSTWCEPGVQAMLLMMERLCRRLGASGLDL